MKRTAIVVSALLAGWLIWGAALADPASPAGRWRTVDDKTGKERSVVVVSEVNGEYSGAVEQIFPFPDDDPQHRCTECVGDRKNKSVIGMKIMWGLKPKGSEWSGGEILDPKNGKIYRCKMSLSEDGNKLNVRGYIGVSLIGRTQTWVRDSSVPSQ
jgi:uncharacterized protein (DUF2147 family)